MERQIDIGDEGTGRGGEGMGGGRRGGGRREKLGGMRERGEQLDKKTREGNREKFIHRDMVLLDLLKTFDTVDHNILSQKLKVMGVEVLWFLSYLGGRFQVEGYHVWNAKLT